MNLLDAFDINRTGHELISLVGAGGKTTTMFALAQALKALSKRVLVSTTTNLFYPAQEECDRVIVSEAVGSGIFNAIPDGSVTVFGKGVVEERKLAGVDKEFIGHLYEEKVFDCILVECDGSKRKPIKAPAHYEPVVPDNTTKTIGVIGLDAIGNPIDEACVHRAELFSGVVGLGMGEILDPEAVVNLIVSPRGLFKGVPEKSTHCVLLNKADTDTMREYGAAIVRGLLERTCVNLDRCLIGTLARGTIYGYTLLR